MEEVYRQLLSLVLFVLTGIVIGILFDIFRVLRKCFKTSDIVTCLQDILFWILTGSITLFSIFQFNQGEIRIYVFLGLFIGILLYMITISKFIVKYTVIVIQMLKKVISYPIQKVSSFFKHFIISPIVNFMVKKKTKNKKEEKTTKMNKIFSKFGIKMKEKKGILPKM